MKRPIKHIFLLVGILACLGRPTFGQDTPIYAHVIQCYAEGYPKIPGPQKLITNFDVAPVPPGGREGYEEFLKQNIKYPKEALEAKISGTVYLSIVIDSIGKLWDVHVEKDNAHYCCGEEAVRVVKMITTWKPAMLNGKPVSVRYIIPVKFKLPG